MLPSALLLFSAALALARPSPTSPKGKKVSLHDVRLAAFNAQRPLHTTALLAGAAATPLAVHELKVRDLRTVTGEDGLWVRLDDLRTEDLGETADEADGDAEEADEEAGGEVQRMMEEKVVAVRRREGWDDGAGDGEI
ncbi:hypothetical protein MMC21_001421 [Puttea exsequens]|nr:hypothetical protein [Puttea exsequens]